MLCRIEAELAKHSDCRLQLEDGKSVNCGRSVMVQMPTGTGKTYVMAAAIRQIRVVGEVWVVAHRRELVEQMQDTLARFGIGFCSCTDIKAWGRAKVRVMSIQWLSRHIEKISGLAAPGLIIIDEAHHSPADSYRALWTTFPKAMRLGFTATPCRMRKENFRRLWDVLLTSWSISRFIRKGRLALYDYVVIGRNSEEQIIIDSLERRGADGDYATAEMDLKLNVSRTVDRLYQSMNKFAAGRKGIVYAIDIKHAKCIADYYSAMGVRAVAIDSKTPAAERTRTVDDFKAGGIGCIVNVNLFDEGFDCPDVEFIQLARPTLSLAKYMQMIGRGLRVHPDKKMCVLIDNVGLYRMFGLPDAERDWKRMFKGLEAGRGVSGRMRNAGVRQVNNDMEVVASHSGTVRQIEFYERTEPFEKDGRWGLRSGNTVVLRPVYRMIMPFVGDYCAYMLAPGMWGVLKKDGRPCVSPEYKKVELLPGGCAILTRSEVYSERIQLE